MASAQSYLAAGNIASAVQDVNDLINEAKAQAGKHIGGSQAAEMIAEAQAAIDAIGILYD